MHPTRERWLGFSLFAVGREMTLSAIGSTREHFYIIPLYVVGGGDGFMSYRLDTKAFLYHPLI